MKNIPGIYIITCTANNKFYIGKSKGCSRRAIWHFRKLSNKIHPNNDFQSDFNVYGSENFTREVLEYCTCDNLHQREVYWIEKLKAVDNGYNKEVPKIIELSKPLYDGKLKIYSLNGLVFLCETASMIEASVLLRESIDRINRVLYPTANNIIKGVIGNYVILEESRTVDNFKSDQEDILTNRANLLNRLSEEEFALKQKENSRKSQEVTRKPIGKFSLDGMLLEKFTHAGDACNKYDEFKYKGLYKAICGINKTYKGFIWKYV